MINSENNSHHSQVVKILVLLFAGYTTAFAQPTIVSFTQTLAQHLPTTLFTLEQHVLRLQQQQQLNLPLLFQQGQRINLSRFR